MEWRDQNLPVTLSLLAYNSNAVLLYVPKCPFFFILYKVSRPRQYIFLAEKMRETGKKILYKKRIM